MRPLRPAEVRAALLVLVLAILVLTGLLILTLGAYLMKPKSLIVAAAVAAALAVGLSGCASLSPLAINHKATPEAQLVQANAKAAFDSAFAARLETCEISGQIGAGLGGIAGAGSGITASGSFRCEPRPWSTLPGVAAEMAPRPPAPNP